MIALGIDPSTKATGLVVLSSSLKHGPDLLCEKSYQPKKLEGMKRVSAILGAIIEIMEEFKPDAIAVENYGLNFQRKTSIIPLVSLGAIIRYYFEQEEIRYLSPTPSEHKRFITGSGNTKKDLIPSFIFEVWGHQPLDGDCADAYGLACMALAHRNALCNANLTMREVAGQLKAF